MRQTPAGFGWWDAAYAVRIFGGAGRRCSRALRFAVAQGPSCCRVRIPAYGRLRPTRREDREILAAALVVASGSRRTAEVRYDLWTCLRCPTARGSPHAGSAGVGPNGRVVPQAVCVAAHLRSAPLRGAGAMVVDSSASPSLFPDPEPDLPVGRLALGSSKRQACELNRLCRGGA